MHARCVVSFLLVVFSCVWLTIENEKSRTRGRVNYSSVFAMGMQACALLVFTPWPAATPHVLDHVARRPYRTYHDSVPPCR